MIVEAYGIKLKRLTLSDIELVRQHRNSDAIRNTMEYREIITPEMQMKWFLSIDNECNNFMLILVDNQAIGLISGTNIDWQKGITNNGGIFIWQPEFIESVYPVKAALLLTDIGFYLGMKRNYIKILRSNTKSIAFNTALGYQVCEGQQENNNRQYELTAERYFLASQKYRQMARATGLIKIVFDNPSHVSSKNIIERIQKLSPDVASKFQISISKL